MDYKELQKRYKELEAEISTFHMFYEEFNKYDLAISTGNGILSEMLSSVIGIKKAGKSNDKVTKQEQMVYELMDIFTMMQGLNNKCQSQKMIIRNQNQRVFNMENIVAELKIELEAIKSAFNDEK